MNPDTSLYHRRTPPRVLSSRDGRSLLGSGRSGLEASPDGNENAQSPLVPDADYRFRGDSSRGEAAADPSILCDAPTAGANLERGGVMFLADPTSAHRVAPRRGILAVTTLDEGRRRTPIVPSIPARGRPPFSAELPPITARCVDLDSQRHAAPRVPESPACSFSPGSSFVRERERSWQRFRRADPESPGSDPDRRTGRPFVLTASFTVAEDGTRPSAGRDGARSSPAGWAAGVGRGARGVTIDIAFRPSRSHGPGRSWSDGRQIWCRSRSGFTARLPSARFGRQPGLAPDGWRIARLDRGGPFESKNILKAASGAGTEELLFHSADSKFPADWSSDGGFLLFDVVTPATVTRTDLWVLPLDGAREPRPYLATAFNESLGRFSPDGRWIAYVSDETGRPRCTCRFPVRTQSGSSPTRAGPAGGRRDDEVSSIAQTPAPQVRLRRTPRGSGGRAEGLFRCLLSDEREAGFYDANRTKRFSSRESNVDVEHIRHFVMKWGRTEKQP